MKNNHIPKPIAVWMDHVQAMLINPNDINAKALTIHLHHTSGRASESNDQEKLHAYYKQLSKELLSYDELFIFGPSTAHNEFYNYLIKDEKFLHKKIKSEKSDYITENQIRETVRNHFAGKIRI
jgi:stalled ribosome rescue protein Dom34